jgi:hypothetical protein
MKFTLNLLECQKARPGPMILSGKGGLADLPGTDQDTNDRRRP